MWPDLNGFPGRPVKSRFLYDIPPYFNSGKLIKKFLKTPFCKTPLSARSDPQLAPPTPEQSKQDTQTLLYNSVLSDAFTERVPFFKILNKVHQFLIETVLWVFVLFSL